MEVVFGGSGLSTYTGGGLWWEWSLFRGTRPVKHAVAL